MMKPGWQARNDIPTWPLAKIGFPISIYDWKIIAQRCVIFFLSKTHIFVSASSVLKLACNRWLSVCGSVSLYWDLSMLNINLQLLNAWYLAFVSLFWIGNSHRRTQYRIYYIIVLNFALTLSQAALFYYFKSSDVWDFILNWNAHQIGIINM